MAPPPKKRNEQTMSDTIEFRDRVLLTIDDDLAYVRMNRPAKRNGLDWDMMRGLIDAARHIRRNRHLRAVILAGEGQAFCAGLDFASFTSKPLRMARGFTKYGLKRTNIFQEVAWCWRKLPVPVIAAVHGQCYGGGLQIALAADFRLATPDAELSVMEIKWGLIPDMTGSVTLRELLPMDQAKELTLTGRLVSGTEAAALNLVTRVSEEPVSEARELARTLATRSPDAVALGKKLLHQTRTIGETRALDTESRLQFRIIGRANQREAMNAGTANRKPDWLPRRVG
jgi:enoyl-CoA hydratase/carnithine racemase